jgi:hypothetical protein
MIKWVLLFYAFLAGEPVFSQLHAAAADTAVFSFDLADGHRGDTVYLHLEPAEMAPPATLKRYSQNASGADMTVLLYPVVH